MLIYYSHFLWVPLVFIFSSCSEEMNKQNYSQRAEFINGVTFVAPSRPFSRDPAVDVEQMGAGWLAVVPYGFTPADESTVWYNHSRQWWGETIPGIIQTVKYGHNAGLKIMLKPQIWARHKWSGEIEYHSENSWNQWESAYRNYILEMAHTADSMNVEMLCIGTELKKSVEIRPLFWAQLIDQIRRIYKGQLTYAANWDSYEAFPFWNEMDYIGINAYFPLSDARHPTRVELIQAWSPIIKKIESLHQRTDKPVLFTEFGYLSTDFNAHNTWEKEKIIEELPVNEAAQSLAIDVLFDCFYPKKWWSGGFIWKWYPPGYRVRNQARDYTVQNKEAEEILSIWYNK